MRDQSRNVEARKDKKEAALKKEKKERKKEKEHNDCDIFLVKILHLKDTSLPFNVFVPNINLNKFSYFT